MMDTQCKHCPCDVDGDHVTEKNVLILILVKELKGNASTLKKRPFRNCLDDTRTLGSWAGKGHRSPGKRSFPIVFHYFSTFSRASFPYDHLPIAVWIAWNACGSCTHIFF